MYYYIYDSCLGEKKYSNVLARIENRLTDLGINGKINRLSFLKNIQQVVNEEIKRGVKTIVIVGNDRTFGQTINLLADLNAVIGYIPVGPSIIARLNNIPEGEAACNILSSRIIKKLDLGKINNLYFITFLEIVGQKVTVGCDDSYFVSPENRHNIITIGNLDHRYKTDLSADDGVLDLFVETMHKNFWGKGQSHVSHLKAKKFKVTGDSSAPIVLNDEKKIVKIPAEITIDPKKLKLIVGKSTHF